MTKGMSSDMPAECSKWSQLLHSHYLQNVWWENLTMPSWIICSPHNHFANKPVYSQSYVFCCFFFFPVVLYWCESLTIKKDECQRIGTFTLWCWRRLFRVPWIARRSSQSILTEINPEYTLEGLLLKLILQYFGHLMGRVDSVEKTLMLEMIKGQRTRGWQRMR